MSHLPDLNDDELRDYVSKLEDYERSQLIESLDAAEKYRLDTVLGEVPGQPIAQAVGPDGDNVKIQLTESVENDEYEYLVREDKSMDLWKDGTYITTVPAVQAWNPGEYGLVNVADNTLGELELRGITDATFDREAAIYNAAQAQPDAGYPENYAPTGDAYREADDIIRAAAQAQPGNYPENDAPAAAADAAAGDSAQPAARPAGATLNLAEVRRRNIAVLEALFAGGDAQDIATNGQLVLIGNDHQFAAVRTLGDNLATGRIAFARNRTSANEITLWGDANTQFVRDQVRDLLNASNYPYRDKARVKIS